MVVVKVKEERQMALELMGTSKAAYLTTVDAEGFPQTRAMFNLRNREQFPGLAKIFKSHRADFMVCFSTNASSSKIADIRIHPGVSVYYCKPEESRGLMLSGLMEIVDDPRVKRSLWQEGWERYYPTGFNDPDHAVLRLFPRMARGWNQDHTYEFVIGGRSE
jgi:general stress protein 26